MLALDLHRLINKRHQMIEQPRVNALCQSVPRILSLLHIQIHLDTLLLIARLRFNGAANELGPQTLLTDAEQMARVLEELVVLRYCPGSTLHKGNVAQVQNTGDDFENAELIGLVKFRRKHLLSLFCNVLICLGYFYNIQIGFQKCIVNC